MGAVLKAENISIRYITGDFKDIGIKEYIMRRLTGNYHVKEFMAVDGVSFALDEGDLLGIIGSNGAGKSTLLKAAAGIMAPTRGKITVDGNVAALLELGSGFDGDLTVRENAYLRGAMLGYTRDFMDDTYDQIIDFAELREFEDRPFKQLSSGMKSRLAFSIASLVQPDVLILDEVLSVGDGAFQEKSAKKMREIISQGAATILVSHSLDQIRELCNKVLWLDHGRQVAFGQTEEICRKYERFLNGESLEKLVEIPAAPGIAPRQDGTNGRTEIGGTAETGRIASLDGLRGIMCVLIALYHFRNEFTLGGLFRNSFLCGEAYFAIAGFLLMRGFKRQGDSFDWIQTMKKYLKRLYPVYFAGLCLIIMLFSAVWFRWNPFQWLVSSEDNRSVLLGECLGLQALGIHNFQYINYPAWYISAMLFGVFLLSILYKRLLKHRKSFYKIAAAFAFGGYGILYALGEYEASAGYLGNTPLPLPIIRSVAGLSFGICLFSICESRIRLRISSGALRGITSICTVILLLFSILIHPGKWNLIFLLLLIPVVVGSDWTSILGQKSFLDTALPQFLGKISYPFFIMQSFSQNMISIYFSRWIQQPAVLAAAFVLLNLACACILRFIGMGRLPHVWRSVYTRKHRD